MANFTRSPTWDFKSISSSSLVGRLSRFLPAFKVFVAFKILRVVSTGLAGSSTPHKAMLALIALERMPSSFRTESLETVSNLVSTYAIIYGAIVKSGVYPIESSGGLIDCYHFDTIFEFDSGYHLRQVIETA